MYCIETEKIIYKFSETETVLKGISLQVPEGSIYGFLGPNGAGKTTTLRLILGLLKKQEGTIKIFDSTFGSRRVDILRKIGSLIESPSVYGHLTAVENLKVLQKVYRCPEKRIQQVLELVGLPGTGNKKASKFSLGMKQRLSIAIALLPDPSLLILDEPTNGLDPNGIIEIRELLKKLNTAYNMTIVISSHLLPEVEKMVTHIGIINEGAMLFQGTLADLRWKQKLGSVIAFETNDANKAAEIIVSNGLIPICLNGLVNIPVVDKEIVAGLTSQFVHSGIEVYQTMLVKNDLESIFIDLIKK